jgi:replicative DNA helicase|tara:strand:+ start:4834 stop:6219 length:1386 start_codon:yes stop_codon:yes gene_type:complete
VSTPTFAEHGTSFQEKIVQALLTDHRWAEQMSEVIRVEYFDMKYLRFLGQRYFDYHKKYKTFPTLQLLVTIIRDDLREGTDVLLRDKIVDFLQRIKLNPDMGDIAYVKDKSLDFCRKQAMREALEKAVDMIATDQDGDVLNIIREALTVGSTPSIGHQFMEDVESRLVNVSRMASPTGIAELDDQYILNGGLAKGELGVIVANTGVGKSHFLVQVGATALLNEKNVVHYTFELSEIATGLRYDSNICEIPINDLIERKQEVLEKYNNIDLGQLVIKEYPTGSASVITIRNHIEKLLLRNFKPDMIIIDYADIMRATRKFETLRHELKMIYEELRNLAGELHIPVWTASQANRSSAQNDVVGLENMSEAYGKAMVADVVLSLSRKSHEKAHGAGRLFIAKNRAGRDGLILPVKIDTTQSRISVLTDNDIQDIEFSRQDQEKSMKDLLRQKWKEVKEVRKISE